MHTRERVVPVTVRVTTLKGADAGLYYVEALGGYYLEPGEPLGVWRGRAVEALGLGAEVDDGAFLDLMAGLHPGTSEFLGRHYGEESVRGFDVTASAPKSVSVLFALGDDATRQAVLDAHDAAVATMVGWIEDHAHTRYRIQGQVATVDADGITAACFRQHTSRALDPQLHTHVVIANRVMSPDGRWLSLDARTIKFDQRTLSALYHAGLRAELTRALGVTWDEPVNRIAEMRGMAADVLAEFSARTEEVQRRIEDKLEAFQKHFERDPTPRERWRLERDAVTDSRPSKSHGVDALSLHAEWAERSVTLGYEPRAVVAATVSQDIPDRTLDAGTEALVVERALESLTESQSSWRPAELVRDLAAAVPTDLSVPSERLAHWLDEVADRVIAERLVELSRPVPDGVALRRDGRPVTESVADRALTTPEVLAQEERLIAWAERRLAAPGHDVAVAVAKDTVPLCGPQLEVAAAVAGTRELVLVVGPAGTGKTSAVSPAVEALRSDGRAVFGVAPSAGAAEVLAVDAALSADTLDKLLVEHRLDRRPDHRFDLPVGATVVVDEAAMVSTPKLAELADLADARGWRLALVGDPLQFSAVGRSGMFGHLIDCYGAIELEDVHRFSHEWEREASLRLRRGDQDVLDLYDSEGRIHGGARRQMESAVVEAWWRARAGGETTAMMAPTNDAALSLNRRAQALRAEHGEIDPSGPSVVAGESILHVGDLVATRRNNRELRTDRNLMVKNRDQWEILAVHRNGALTVFGRTGHVRLPADYVADQVQLGYAETGHAKQGRTVDRGFLLLDGPTDMRGVYVPMTRGRHGNEVFVVLEGEATALDVLRQALSHSWVDQPAVARRAELAQAPLVPEGRGPATSLGVAEIRELLERRHALGHTIFGALGRMDTFGAQVAQATDRQERLRRELSEAESRLHHAQQVIDDYDHPLRRRLHRDELNQARRHLHQASGVVRDHTAELADIERRLPGLEASLADAQATYRDRPRMEWERHAVGRLIDSDLARRTPGLAADPPDYLVDHLGPRPERGAAADVWDEAAARIDQHRYAFGITDTRNVLGSLSFQWENTAFAENRRDASNACDRLDRSLGRGREIEPPSLELGL